jgi:hypothetical protein
MADNDDRNGTPEDDRAKDETGNQVSDHRDTVEAGKPPAAEGVNSETKERVVEEAETVQFPVATIRTPSREIWHRLRRYPTRMWYVTAICAVVALVLVISSANAPGVLKEVPRWPAKRIRRPSQVEDSLLVTSSRDHDVVISANRLTAGDGKWNIAGDTSLTKDQHGACLVALADGNLIGILVLVDLKPAIAFLP